MLRGVPSRQPITHAGQPGAAITYAGHATVLIEMGEARLLTDPLLREHLLVVLRRHSGVDREALGRVDGVLISHLHRDHVDLASLRRLGRSVPILAPPRSARFFARRGFTNVSELAPGETANLAGVDVRAVEARHDGGRMFGFGKSGVVGYVVEGPRRVYWAGDTALFDGMRDIGENLDVAMLPIWGWGPTLGPGHLDPERAAQALAMLRPRFAVPVHWGTLAPLGARRVWPWLFERPAREFTEWARRLAPEVEVRVLEPGQTLRLDEA
jgi:L-ascorbate metabolism protein UlaG (beta-lactamase superfamily)